jgi:DNA polymerase elongation subunit (family B)
MLSSVDLQQLARLPEQWRYTPVNGRKTPYLKGWERKPVAKQCIGIIAQGNRKCHGVGLLLGELSGGLLAVDHDGDSCNSLIEQLTAVPIQEALPQTVGFTSGKLGRYQLLYQVPELFRPYIRSKVILTGVKGSNGKDEQLDFRWSGRQSVILGSHPETGGYQWLPSQTPWEVKVAQCPKWIVRQLLSFHPLRVKNRKDWTDRDWALSYLEWIPNSDLDWYSWRDILLALHHAGVEEELARVWSASSNKYTDKEFDSVWRHIDDNCTNPLTVAYLGQLAKENGWRGQTKAENIQPQALPLDSAEVAAEVSDFLQLEHLERPIILPTELMEAFDRQAQKLNVPVEVYVACSLPVFASQIQIGTRLELDASTDYYAPPIILLGLVGDTGSKKTPITRAVTSPLDILQQVSEQEYQQQFAAYEQELLDWEATPKDERGIKPKPPVPQEYYLSDFTLEALTQVLDQQKDQGLLIYIDELSRFFAAMDAYRSGKGGDRQHWLSFYDGGPVKFNRKTTGRVYSSRTAISLLGGIQPEIIHNLMLTDGSSADGLWARFAWTRLPLAISQGICGQARYDLSDMLLAVYQQINQFSPQTYRLPSEAQLLWNQWHLEIEHLILKEPSSILRATYPKAKERAARIALVSHLAGAAFEKKAPEPIIPVGTLRAAIQFTRWLMGQTRLIYAEMGVVDNPQTTRILRLINRFEGCGWVNTRQVRNSWSGKEKPTAADLRAFMAQVVSQGHAVDNGKQGADYQIKITKISSPLVHDVPRPLRGGNFSRDYNSVHSSPFSPSISGSEEDKHRLEDMDDPCTNETPDSLGKQPQISTQQRVELARKDEEDNLQHMDYADYQWTTVSPSLESSEQASLQPFWTNGLLNIERDNQGNGATPTPQPPDNPRNACTVQDGKVEVDLDKLSLDYRSEIAIPSWQPSTQLKPYESLSKLYLDIETSGLDPECDRVLMVGFLDEAGNQTILTNQDEKQLLGDTLQFLRKNQPQLLIGHNLFKFDLPFLMQRWKYNQISHPFRLDHKPRIISASSFQGKPIEFTPVRWSGTQIVDTFQQACIWDKSAAKLTSYNLKSCCLTLGLRKAKRLELSADEILAAWNQGDTGKIAEYLAYDLEDTLLLADYLLPIVYYQLAIVPDISLQDVAVASPALKAQKIHEALMPGIKPQPDRALEYQGALISCTHPGLHRQIAKIDVSSLYPSIMLRFGICSQKDTQHRFLGVMQYMTSERLKLKQLAKSGNIQAGHEQNALKILINGSYGFLGTKGYSFNDYQAAALVTAYGRKILMLMENVVTTYGGTVIELDTDGIIFSHPQPQQIAAAVQHALPDQINVELEFSDCGIYIPKAKSYVIVHSDGKTTIKGLFRKRDRYPLEKEFPVGFLHRYFQESPPSAEQYYHHIRAAIATRQIAIEQLTVTRKIGAAETRLVSQGLGKPGEVVSFYYTQQKRFHARSQKPLPSVAIEATSGDYWVEWYLTKLDRQYQEITGRLPQSAVIEQLTLLDS